MQLLLKAWQGAQAQRSTSVQRTYVRMYPDFYFNGGLHVDPPASYCGHCGFGPALYNLHGHTTPQSRCQAGVKPLIHFLALALPFA